MFFKAGWGVCTVLAIVCLCMCVSPHHSLLIRYGDVSMLQACMIKRTGLNMKPYRDQEAVTKSRLGSQCVCICVCV